MLQRVSHPGNLRTRERCVTESNIKINVKKIFKYSENKGEKGET